MPPLVNDDANTTARLLVTSKTGKIHILNIYDDDKNQTTTTTPILIANLQDRICGNGERGVGSARADPNDPRYVYVYYTYHDGRPNCTESPVDGPVNRLSRFTFDDVHRLDLSTEHVLLQTPPLAKRNHNGGGMVVDAARRELYLAIGDAGTPLRERVSQDTTNVLGTLVRLTLPDGGIPEDNPLVADPESGVCSRNSSGGKCQEIFAWGLRNPIQMVPNTAATTTSFFVNDVGGASWEESNVGGLQYAGVNYGYPLREGPCDGLQSGGNNMFDCAPPPAEPESGLPYREPWHFYNHRDRTDLGGGCITAGAMVPRGFWPSPYDGAFMFADFVFGEMYCK